jgi:hypothetical protein
MTTTMEVSETLDRVDNIVNMLDAYSHLKLLRRRKDRWLRRIMRRSLPIFFGFAVGCVDVIAPAENVIEDNQPTLVRRVI